MKTGSSIGPNKAGGSSDTEYVCLLLLLFQAVIVVPLSRRSPPEDTGVKSQEDSCLHFRFCSNFMHVLFDTKKKKLF